MVHFCGVVLILSLSFGDCTISITKKPQGSQHPTRRVNLRLIWFLLSLASISFLRDVVWVSVVLNRTVVR